MDEQTWRATISYANTSTPDSLGEEMAGALCGQLPEGQVTFDGRHAHLSMTVTASTYRRAHDDALRHATTAYRDTFDVVGEIVAGRVLTTGQEWQEAAHPPPQDLISLAQAAEDILGVSRQAAAELVKTHPDAPNPVAAGKVHLYSRTSMEIFQEYRNRTGGWAEHHARQNRDSA